MATDAVTIAQGYDSGVRAIPESEWHWFGNAGHFICAQWCRFHLCTQVGDFLVSTVGEYLPPEAVREVIASSRGVVLKLQGDAREAEYLQTVGFEQIGYHRLYETMVFKAGGPCICGCGLPTIDGHELDMEGYNEAGAATAGHYAMCRRWASKKG